MLGRVNFTDFVIKQHNTRNDLLDVWNLSMSWYPLTSFSLERF